jgi:hypothetical protein
MVHHRTKYVSYVPNLGLLLEALHLPPLQLQVLAEVGRHLSLLLQLTCSIRLLCKPVLQIRIHVFLGLLDPDPDSLVRGTDPAPDPDPSIIKQKW